MRALHPLLVAAVAACTPEIVSGSYLCGPNASCPAGQACNGEDHVCVLAGAAKPFSCEADIVTEPDDTPQQAHGLGTLDCVSVATVLDNCMMSDDGADWYSFKVDSSCTAVAVDARVSFPFAFERLGLELWDLERNEVIAHDDDCTSGTGAAGEDLRCLVATLAPGASYGVQVLPTGTDNCDGDCAYNRYTVRVQLTAPR